MNEESVSDNPFALLVNMRDGGGDTPSVQSNPEIHSSSHLNPHYMNEIELTTAEPEDDGDGDDDDYDAEEDDDDEDEDDDDNSSETNDDDGDDESDESDKKSSKRIQRNLRSKTKSDTKKGKKQKSKSKLRIGKKNVNAKKKQSKTATATATTKATSTANLSELLTFEEQQEIEEPVEIDLRNVYKTYGINPIDAGRQRLFRKTSNDIVDFSIGEASIKFGLGKTDDAISLLFEVIRMNPLNAEPYDALGELYMRMGNYQKALEFYLLGIEFNQCDHKRWAQVADIAELNRMHKSAIQFYSRAIKLSPRSTTYYIKKCNLLERMQQYDNALKTYERLLLNVQQSTDTDYKIISSIVFRIAGVLMLQHRLTDALEVVERALDTYSIESERERFRSFLTLYVCTYFDLLLRNRRPGKVLAKFLQYRLIEIDDGGQRFSPKIDMSVDELPDDQLIELITGGEGKNGGNSTAIRFRDCGATLIDDGDGDSEPIAIDAQTTFMLKSKFVCALIRLRQFEFVRQLAWFGEIESLLAIDENETNNNNNNLRRHENIGNRSTLDPIFAAIAESLIDVERYEWAFRFVSPLLISVRTASSLPPYSSSSASSSGEITSAIHSRYWYLYGVCLGHRSGADRESSIGAFERAIRADAHNYDAMNELSRVCNLIGDPERALDNVSSQLDHQRDACAYAKIEFKLLLTRCNLLFVCKRWEDFLSTGSTLLRSVMFLISDWNDVGELIHPNMSVVTMCRVSKRLCRKYSKRSSADPGSSGSSSSSARTKLTGGRLSGEQWFDLWRKCVFTLLAHTKQYQEAVRWALSAMLSPFFADYQFSAITIMFRACVDAKSLPYTYELARFLVKEYPRSGKVWYAFSVAMNDIYQDFRHKRFCMRVWKSNPENVNVLMMNGLIALLNGRYRHALAIFLLVFRRASFRYDSFYVALCYLHLLMQNHTMDKCSLIAQMLTFFADYVQKIGKCQETYYNLARVYHQLGFVRHAVQLYSVALCTPLKIHDTRFDLSPEIAFNLSQIYRRSGEHERANRLIARYCTI